MVIKIPGSKKFWACFLVAAMFAMTMATVFNWQRIDTLWVELNGTPSNSDSLSSLGSISTKVYIQNAMKGLYSNEVVTDPTQNKVYLPEARIYLPLTSLSRGIHYGFWTGYEGGPARASLTTNLNLNRLVNSFSDVPCAQSMAGFTIGKGSYINDDGLVGTRTLSDGRTLYIYENKNKDCQNYWPEGYGSDALVKLLNEAQSY